MPSCADGFGKVSRVETILRELEAKEQVQKHGPAIARARFRALGQGFLDYASEIPSHLRLPSTARGRHETIQSYTLRPAFCMEFVTVERRNEHCDTCLAV